MDFAVITGPTKRIALPRICLANTLTDGVELRLDLFKEMDINDVAEMRKAAEKKVIYTLRLAKNGGGYKGSLHSRQALIEKLLVQKPDYVDIESNTDKNFIQLVSEQTNVILSYHNFEYTPSNLETILTNMQLPYVYAYKICTTSNSLSDSYRMLRFIQKAAAKKIRIIGLCMGDDGSITREEGIKSGNYLNYKILHKQDRCASGLQLA